MGRVDSFLAHLVTHGGSDLHLSSGALPMARIRGQMVAIAEQPFTDEATSALVAEIMSSEVAAEFARTHDADFAYESPGLGRFRVNAFVNRNGTAAVFRHVPEEVPSVDDLDMPQVVRDFTDLPKGLVLVTGPTGSGKSTTLASMIDAINTHKSSHIITIEDPIEFVHKNKKSLVNQREVGAHTDTFTSGLRAALREDPDVILVGEMRDLETTAMAIEAAETGHLVFGTLHTSSAPSTVDRIIDQFPAGQQAQVRTMLSASLQGVVSQCLLSRRDESGRVACLEILVSTPAISNLIREGKSHQLMSALQTGGRLGMTTLNDALVKLVSRGTVEAEEAYAKSADKESLLQAFKIAGIKFLPRTRSSAAHPSRVPAGAR